MKREKLREALDKTLIVDSWKIREETDQEKETTEEEHPLVKINDLGVQGAQEDKVELKERDTISENLVQRVFTEPNRESGIPKEPR